MAADRSRSSKTGQFLLISCRRQAHVLLTDLWTAAIGYLVVAACAAWGFGHLAGTAAGGGPGGAGLIWGAALSVAAVGLVLTWAVLRMAAVRLSVLAESAAAGRRGDALGCAGLPRTGPRNLESAIASMKGQLETRIEELQRKGRQLQESTERLETVLGSMLEGVVAVDENQRVLFANRAARTLLDIEGTNRVGRPVWEVLRHPRIDEVIRTVLSGGETPALEIDLPRKHAVVAVIASRLPGSPSSGVVLVFHNVTELRRLENIRREFVSNVSHELKTPLTAIQAYTETLLDGLSRNPNIAPGSWSASASRRIGCMPSSRTCCVWLGLNRAKTSSTSDRWPSSRSSRHASRNIPQSPKQNRNRSSWRLRRPT